LSAEQEHNANSLPRCSAAVTFSRLRVKPHRETKVSLHPCFLHVWVKKNVRWQMVAHQATKIE
jgi:hypothetical protein